MSHITTLTASDARSQLHPLIDTVSEDGPVQIVGRRHSAMLVSLDEWNAITETLHIASQPAVMEKIRGSESELRTAMKTLDEIMDDSE